MSKYTRYIEPKTGSELNGLQIGAFIKDDEQNQQIVTGPLTWNQFGGGFSCNLDNSNYEVWLNGEVTHTGGSRDALFLKVDRTGLLYNTNHCDNSAALDGYGTLYVRGKEWFPVGFKADFCRSMMLVRVEGSIPTIPSQSDAFVKGLLFAGSESTKGAEDAFLYLPVSSEQDPYNQFNANLDFILGHNVSRNKPHIPKEITNTWGILSKDVLNENGNKLNGLYLRSSIDIPEQLGNGIKNSPDISYRYNASSIGEFYAHFNDEQFSFKVSLSSVFYTARKVVELNATNLYFNKSVFSGGYSNQIDGNFVAPKQWFFNKSLEFPIEIGTNSTISCNSIEYDQTKCCFNGDKLGFKTCSRPTINLQYRQWEAVNILIDF
jgi:hypothetical protein